MAEPNLFADFGDDFLENQQVPAALVYTRDRWDEEWTFQPDLRCNGCLAAVAPATGSAELVWTYGLVKQPDELEKSIILPDDGHRRYVRILWLNTEHAFGDEIRHYVWYGIVNGVGARIGGVRSDGFSYETGEQTIQCVGLEKILDEQPIHKSAWFSHELQEVRFVDRGLAFNSDRADGVPGGNMEGIANWPNGVPVFSGKVLLDDSFWTTCDAIQYLVGFNRPSDKNEVELPVGINPDSLALLEILQDRPQLETHGRTLRQMLNQLLPHQRFVTWYVSVDESLNAIFINIVPLPGDALELPSGDTIQANPRRWNWQMNAGRTSPILVLSHAEGVERVRIQGARRTSTGSFSNPDGTLVAGYTAAQKTLWDAGGEAGAAFAAAGSNKTKKNALNEEVRSRDALREVYSRFKCPDDWDGRCQNGEGVGTGALVFPFEQLFFPTTDIELFSPAKFYQREVYFEPYVMLRDGYLYTTLTDSDGNTVAPVQLTDGPHNFLPPVVVIKTPATGSDASRLAAFPRWRHIERLASELESVPGDASKQFSGHVSVPRLDRAIVIKVDGHKQYVIAGADYTNKSYEDKYYPWDWKTIIATVTIKGDEYCEGSWPAAADLPGNDYKREALFNAGDDYRLDWIAQGTVIGIDAEGALQRTTGGWIQDDRQKLQDRARMAFAWYGVPRQAISFPTPKINGSIQLGDYVVSAGDVIHAHEINTVITSIRIDCQGAGMGGSPPIPMITYQTDWVADMSLFVAPSMETTRHTTVKRMSQVTPTGSSASRNEFAIEMGKQKYNPTRLIQGADHGRSGPMQDSQ